MSFSIKRRKILKDGTLLMSAFPLLQIEQFPLLNISPMDNEVTKFKLGQFDCTVFRDLSFSYLASDFFINANKEELKQALTKYNIPSGVIPSPFVAILLQNTELIRGSDFIAASKVKVLYYSIK